MTAHDTRMPLGQGKLLTIQHRDYTIRETIGLGGSCLAYSAERLPSEYEREAGMPVVPVIIKEFYPLELVESITRKPNGELNVMTTAQGVFDLMKGRFESGATEQTAFCVSNGNHSLPLPIFEALNGTVYSAVTLTNGQTLADCGEPLSVFEKADMLTSLCNAVKKLHSSGRLYLDLKPSNIFLFEKEPNESRRVALFDFDTAISADEITTAVISYSEGWSPYEQLNLRREDISYTADVYAIGAVYYRLLSGKKVSDEILNEIVRGRYGFLDEIEVLKNNKRLKEIIGQILSATLKRLPSKRAQGVEDIPL